MCREAPSFILAGKHTICMRRQGGGNLFRRVQKSHRVGAPTETLTSIAEHLRIVILG